MAWVLNFLLLDFGNVARMTNEVGGPAESWS